MLSAVNCVGKVLLNWRAVYQSDRRYDHRAGIGDGSPILGFSADLRVRWASISGVIV